MTKIMDEWFDNKIKTMRESRQTSRTGRASLPQIVADMFFGPPKD